MKLIAATGNAHKLIEFEAITKQFGFELAPKGDVGLGDFDPEESGETFAENSLAKAKAICERCGLPCIADDSGIVVDALGGAPGIHSARYAGEHGDDAGCRAKLLRELSGVPAEKRTGRFTAVITIIWPKDAPESDYPAFAEKTADGYRIPGDQRYVSPGTAECPGDFSNAAFFLAAGALSPEPVGVAMALPQQVQGDSAIVPLLVQAGAIQKREGNIFSFQKGEPKAMDISASDIPDLVPILSLYAAAAPGVTRIRNAQRLRLKESDRLQSVCRLLTALGADVQETPDGLLIKGGTPLRGGTVDSCNDHRIAMTAAIAACVGSEPVTIRQFEAVNKSYPDFLRDLALLGGRFCQEE